MTTILTAFNTQLINFTDELIILCPEEHDFKVFKNGILLLKRTNPRKIIELFNVYVVKYKESILEKNETFFLDNNYNDDIDTDDIENLYSIINKLKKYWCSLSDSNKETVWKYLQVLIKLNDIK
tara:strand:+ start:243 stop:614 length:372 start_codon:yes stop_codon:yes gene_type:complete